MQSLQEKQKMSVSLIRAENISPSVLGAQSVFAIKQRHWGIQQSQSNRKNSWPHLTTVNADLPKIIASSSSVLNAESGKRLKEWFIQNIIFQSIIYAIIFSVE